MFGSCFRTLAVILVSALFVFSKEEEEGKKKKKAEEEEKEEEDIIRHKIEKKILTR